ncbi:thiosulfate sulfurtransferase [Stella humosa]|uniref:Thiosulfate sulfurtransferase n=1 Tax=Stella humosa TaxID=94 RepID=A0A3N1LHN2_9PROT|nr:thiosulfate sulfurtransferase [Stella humosa]
MRAASNEGGGGPAYAGDLSSQEAWRMLAEDARAVLIDVRTRPEWMFVGVPDLSTIGKRAAFLSWQSFPTMEVAADFVQSMEKSGIGHDQTILFLCRSGARSRSAAIAATKAGYARAFNIGDGFEGPPDSERHRGRITGWKAAGLPWTQE